MESVPGIYLVQCFTTFTFLLSFSMRHLSTVMSNQGDDRPDHPVCLGFEMEIWEIVLWSHRLIENWATWLRFCAALFTSRVPAHFPCSQPESGCVRDESDRCRMSRASWSWGSAYTWSPCLPILPAGPQTRGGEPLLQWLGYWFKITRSGPCLRSDFFIFGQATSLPCASFLIPCIHLFYLPRPYVGRDGDLPILVISFHGTDSVLGINLVEKLIRSHIPTDSHIGTTSNKQADSKEGRH